MGIIQAIVLFVRAFIMGRAAAAAENLALRQQVAVYKHSVKRPKLRPRDRVFWVCALPALVQLAIRAGHRPTRNGHQVAPTGIQALLAMEVEGRETRTPSHPTRTP